LPGLRRQADDEARSLDADVNAGVLPVLALLSEASSRERVRTFEQEARRARIRLVIQHLSGELDREQIVDGITSVLDGPPYGAHTGYYRDHKHPLDRAAETEEAWRFPQ